jgi:glutamine amidotransferase
MQLLFDDSDEGAGAGLGIVPGRVERVRSDRVPQIGWNTIEDPSDDLFRASGLHIAYYANSFVCRPADPAFAIAWSTHETDRFPAAVRTGRTVGVQFHPEKSSAPGLRFIEEFLRQC